MVLNPADVCVPFLSIVNKDLSFFIIESYEWRTAHGTEQHTQIQMKGTAYSFPSWLLVLVQNTVTDTDPLAAGGLSVGRWDSLEPRWWHSDICVPGCVLE